MKRAVLGLLALVICLGSTAARGMRKVEITDLKKDLLAERKGVWTLEFWYKPVKFIKVQEAGKKTVMYWYLLYKVENRAGKPCHFVPAFELVTDTDVKYLDVLAPAAQKAVEALWGTTPATHNSITICGDVPPVVPNKKPVEKRGVAFFKSVDPKTDFFSIYVTGLSNGYRKIVDPKTKKVTYRYKTLKLSFSMPGDEFYPDEDEIRLLEPEWIYR